MILKGIYRLSSVIVLLCILSHSISAQKGQEVGIWLGLAHYFGDLNTDYSLNDPGLAAGILYRKNFNNRICLATGLSYGSLKASDDDSANSFESMRNLSFKSNVFDAHLALEFNFFTYIHGSTDYYYTPYATLGVAVSKFNPKAELDGTTYVLRDFSTEGQGTKPYGLLSGALLYGLGFKWDLSYKWSFNVALNARRLTTDYLDDVSTVYPNSASLQGGPDGIAAQLSDRSGIEGFATTDKQRGNSMNNDTYVLLSFSIMRYFSQLECPKVSKIKPF